MPSPMMRDLGMDAKSVYTVAMNASRIAQFGVNRLQGRAVPVSREGNELDPPIPVASNEKSYALAVDMGSGEPTRAAVGADRDEYPAVFMSDQMSAPVATPTEMDSADRDDEANAHSVYLLCRAGLSWRR